MYHCLKNNRVQRSVQLQLPFLLFLSVSCFTSAGLFTQTGTDRDAQLAEADELHGQTLKLYREGKYEEAINLAKRELAIREKWLDKEDLKVAETLQTLGMLYREKGEYVRAEPLYQRALSIREKILGENDPRVATTLSHLGQLNR